MTGPEHYAEAQRLGEAYKDAIKVAEEMPSDTRALVDDRYFAAMNARALLDKAQLHATLALVGAIRGPANTAWTEVLA